MLGFLTTSLTSNVDVIKIQVSKSICIHNVYVTGYKHFGSPITRDFLFPVLKHLPLCHKDITNLQDLASKHPKNTVIVNTATTECLFHFSAAPLLRVFSCSSQFSVFAQPRDTSFIQRTYNISHKKIFFQCIKTLNTTQPRTISK